MPNELSGFYEYEIRRHYRKWDLVKIIFHPPEIKLHRLSNPARRLFNVLTEL
jgi:hypothetical protein